MFFLENELKKSRDNTKIDVLIKVRDSLKIIKQQEFQEREKESEELENLLLEF